MSDSHRNNLGVDPSNFGNEWTKCIDQEWLKVLLLLCFNNLLTISHVFFHKRLFITISLLAEETDPGSGKFLINANTN